MLLLVVNGYYLVTSVLSNLTQITINLTLRRSSSNTKWQRSWTYQFVNQRVAQPLHIAELDLNEAEFSKNTVWVDEATDGSWGVYQKSINYSLTKNLNRADGQEFGSAIAYTPKMGYLISDKRPVKFIVMVIILRLVTLTKTLEVF